MNLSDISAIYNILKRENLTPISVIDEDKIVCASASNEKYLIKECRGIEEKIVTEVLPKINALNLDFQTLELPTYHKVITTETTTDNSIEPHKIILLGFYEGTTFNQAWNEISPHGYGGRAVDLKYSDKILELLKDFSTIPIVELKEFNLPTFNFEKWKKQNFPILTNRLIEKQILTQAQAGKATTLLDNPKLFTKSKMILTNGDFYPRNFIELQSEKIVVIDWEGREDYRVQVDLNGNSETVISQRNALINYLEGNVAFLFIHMWGNYLFQKRFIKSASREFNLSVESLRAAIIIKSLEQAVVFGDRGISMRQAEIFVNSLYAEYIEDFLR